MTTVTSFRIIVVGVASTNFWGHFLLAVQACQNIFGTNYSGNELKLALEKFFDNARTQTLLLLYLLFDMVKAFCQSYKKTTTVAATFDSSNVAFECNNFEFALSS